MLQMAVWSQNSTCCVTTRHARRVVRIAPYFFQYGGRRRISIQYSARVYKFSLLCSRFASISGTTFGKSEVDIHPSPCDATEHVRASRACRACRDARLAPCCLTSAAQHVVTFSCAKMHVLDSVSCCEVTQQVEFGLNSGYDIRQSWKSFQNDEMRVLLQRMDTNCSL